jgi:sugar-specific transcriptional regulator TrmB
MSRREAVESLTALGFTPLEAEIYTFLLQESPATGYRVAQALAKPVAGVYKGLTSLAEKGAVLVDEGASRQCRAVPAEELISGLARAFGGRCSVAVSALTELRAAPEDSRVYQLRTREQVMERARNMLSRCKQIALLDVFPAPLAALKEEIEGAAHRGVTVAVQTYEPTDLRVSKTVPFPGGPSFIKTAPWQLLILAVDGSEHLIAFFTKDGTLVRQAFWSGSAPLSWVLQSFMASELIFVGVLSDPETPAEIKALVRKHGQGFPSLFDVPGYQQSLGFGRFPNEEEPEK